MASSGICGSDLHLVSFGPSPVTLGHEFCGRLDDGTPVAVLPAVRCGRCTGAGPASSNSAPRSSVPCTEPASTAVWPTWRGSTPAAPRPSHPASPSSRPAWSSPSPSPCTASIGPAWTPGTAVLVIGAGPIGLCSVAAALGSGASVDVLGHRPERLGAAERLGAGRTVGTGYDMVLDAAGTQGSMDQAAERVRPGGTVGVLANFWEPVSVGMGLQIKEAILVPAFTYGHPTRARSSRRRSELLDATPDLPGAVITHRFPLDEAAEAFRVAADRASGAIKVVVEP